MVSFLTQNLTLTNDPTTVLDKAFITAQYLLNNFISSEDFITDLRYIFGNQIQNTMVREVFQSLAQQTAFSLKIIAGNQINNALGAYAQATNTIYLSQEFIENNFNNSQTIAAVILEETGHYIDAQLNTIDTSGDEGELFAAKLQSKILDIATQNRIAQENDSYTVTLDGQEITIEQATPGINPAFDLIGLTQLRNDPQFAGIDGSGVTAVIIDTGLDRTHPLLQPNYRTGIDFVNGGDNPVDNQGHGTHVSGTVGATNENIGVAPQAGLIGLQVFQSGGRTSFLTVEEALEWVYNNRQQYNIVVVNMSLGSGFYSSPGEVQGDILSDDIRRLEEIGVTVVSAGGNSFKNNEYQNYGAPAIYSTLAIGSVWQDGTESNFQWGGGATDITTGADRVVSHSQRLNAPNTIFAPGALINSTVPGGGQERLGGTSMASPHVAGAVALMQEAALQFGGRLLAPSEVVEIMRGTADSIFDGDDENDNVQNTQISYPRLNIYRAITEIKNRFAGNAPPPPGGNAGDSNGTIAGAIIGPTLDGSPVNPILGSIGIDGNSTNIGNTDVDIYRFQLASPGNITISLGTNTSNPADFDSLLRLFDSAGNELAFNDDNGSSQFSNLQATLGIGTYYVGVSGYNNRSYNPTVAGSGIGGGTGNYSLQFSLGNADPNGLISGAVDVNLGNDQEPLIFDGLIGADYGAPVSVADVDLFKIVVPDNGTLFVDIDTPYESDYVDSYLRFFDENGTPLVFSDTGELIESDDDLSYDRAGNETEFTDFLYPELVFEDPFDREFYNGHRTDSFVAGTVSRGDVYYIGVSDYFNSDYDPTTLNGRPAIGDGGQYKLEVTFVNNDLNGSITQSISDATLPIVNRPGIIGADGDPVTGGLSQVGNKDVDFFKVRSATAGILEVDITSSTSDPVDTVAFIFDGNGNLLTSDDDTDDFDPLIQYQIAANQNYFVAVTGYGNDNFDPFALGSGTGGDIGEYTLNSRILSSSQATVLSDNTINNGAVQNISVYQTIFDEIGKDNGFVTGASDVDIYRFVPTTTNKIEIRVNANEEFGADTFLRLFDINGNELAANDNEASNIRGSVLQVDLAAGTTYLIGVNGASSQARNYNPITGTGAASGSQGTYNITLQQVIDPAQYGASHIDLIRVFGYNLPALKNHFQTTGRLEGRSPDSFDELRYTASNPDLIPVYRFDPAGATQHYIQLGYQEPNRSLTSFDASQYLASNPDLIGVFGYNFTEITRHYVQSGFFDPRSSDSFDELRYTASNPDLIPVYRFDPAGATQHYIQLGYQEPNRSLTSFDASQYLASNPDLIGVFGYNFTEITRHYVQYGFFDPRSSDSFDELRYLASKKDLIQAFGLNPAGATQHYIQFGYQEQNRSLTAFEADRYIASNPDLVGALGYNLLEGTLHYINRGALIENRSTTFFSAVNYLNRYSDLQTAFLGDLTAATRHFIEHGFSENRIGT
jgi:hypothetical protein